MPTWTLEHTLPGGHRLFRKGDDEGVYIADESGTTPDLTDDGELWLDSSRPIEVSLMGALVPVCDDDDNHHVVGVTMPDALYLSARYGFHVHADADGATYLIHPKGD